MAEILLLEPRKCQIAELGHLKYDQEGSGWVI